MMPDVCERLVLVPGRFFAYQSTDHTSLHTTQCNAQMKISFPELIFAQNKSINIIIIIIIIQNFIHRFKKIDYLQIQEYEILKYIPYVHSSCVRKRIVVK